MNKKLVENTSKMHINNAYNISINSSMFLDKNSPTHKLPKKDCTNNMLNKQKYLHNNINTASNNINNQLNNKVSLFDIIASNDFSINNSYMFMKFENNQLEEEYTDHFYIRQDKIRSNVYLLSFLSSLAFTIYYSFFLETKSKTFYFMLAATISFMILAIIFIFSKCPKVKKYTSIIAIIKNILDANLIVYFEKDNVEYFLRYYYMSHIYVFILFIVLVLNYKLVIYAHMIIKLAMLIEMTINQDKNNINYFKYTIEILFVSCGVMIIVLKSLFEHYDRSNYIKIKKLEKIEEYYKMYLKQVNFGIVSLIDSVPSFSNNKFNDMVEKFYDKEVFNNNANEENYLQNINNKNFNKNTKAINIKEDFNKINDNNLDLSDLSLNQYKLKYLKNIKLKKLDNNLNFLFNTLKDKNNYNNFDLLYIINQIIVKLKLQNCNNDLNNKNIDNINSKFIELGQFYILNSNCGLNSLEFKEATLIIQLRIFSIGLYNKNEIIDIVIKDISYIQEIEKNNAETKLKQKMFSKLAHEFKTPFIVIKNELKELSDSLYNETINKSNKLLFNLNSTKLLSNKCELLSNLSEYTLFLIDDVIQYSSDFKNLKINIEEDCFLEDIAEFSYKILLSYNAYSPGNRKNLKLELNIDENAKRKIIKTDVLRVKQILLNFISNAVKFTKRGYIKIIIKHDYILDSIVIEVIDTGKGIDKALLNKIKVLLSSKEKDSYEKDENLTVLNINTDYDYNQMGSGIGINICSTLIKKLENHKLEIESEENIGTIARLKLPVSKNTCFKSKNLFVKKSNVIKFAKSSFKIKSNKIDKKYNTHKSNKILNSQHNKLKNNLLSKFHLNLNKLKSNICNSSNIPSVKGIKDYYRFNSSNNINENKKTCLISSETKKISYKYSYYNIINRNSDSEDSCVFSDEYINNRSSDDFDSLKQNNKIFNNLKISRFDYYYYSNFKKETLSFKLLNYNVNKSKILIVDDSFSIRSSLKKLINSIVDCNKIDVLEGEDGSDIIKFVSHDNLNSKLIKLIITDENMEIINGSEAIKILRQLEKKNKINKINIVSLTAFSDNNTINCLYDIGANKVMLKPVNKSDLKKIINDYT